MTFKKLINSILGFTGYQLRHKSAYPDPMLVQKELVTAKSPIILDVGAHTGRISSGYLKLFPAAQIHAFEPSPDSFEKLTENFKKKPITLNRAAVGAQESIAKFYINLASQTNSLLPSSSDAVNNWGQYMVNSQIIDVPVITLDAYCERNGISHINILKLDIQGAELLALEGAKRMIEARAIDLIYLEIIFLDSYIGQPSAAKYFSQLEEYGYKVYGLYDICRKKGQISQCDAIFKRKE